MVRFVGFDTETTGLDADTDRVCEVALIEYDENLEPTGRRLCTLVDPQRPMPHEVIDIHGITDEMVAGKPAFADIAEQVQGMLTGDGLAYIIAQNAGFDMAFIHYELIRAGQPGISATHPVVDTLTIERKAVKHDLSSMHFRYFGEAFEGAHRADVDVEATVRVLRAQIEAHGLEKEPDALVGHCLPDDGRRFVDFSRKLYYTEGDTHVRYAFGKFQDAPVLRDPDTRGYAKWMCSPKASFPADTVAVLRQLLQMVGIRV